MNEKSLKTNSHKYKIKLTDVHEVLARLNDLLYRYIKFAMISVIKKINRKNINLKQKGGRTVLPLEYFGINTKDYYSANNLVKGEIMNRSTDTIVRPAINIRKIQNGGKVILPSEYYGDIVRPGSYNLLSIDPPIGQIMNQSTNDIIRPKLDMNVISPGQVGGGHFKISVRMVQENIHKILSVLNAKKLKIQDIVVKNLKDKCERLLDEIFNNLYGKELNDSILKVKLNQKKFQKYYKKI